MINKRDQEIIQVKLIKMRANGDGRSPEVIIREMKEKYPDLTEEIIESLEADPMFIHRLTGHIIQEYLHKDREVYEALLSKAIGGSFNHMRLYYELTGRLKNTLKIESKASSEDMSSMSYDEIVAAYDRAVEDRR